MQNHIYFGDNLEILGQMPDASVDLVYIDPPFNTGRKQARTQIKTERSNAGDRVGFGDQRFTLGVYLRRKLLVEGAQEGIALFSNLPRAFRE